MAQLKLDVGYRGRLDDLKQFADYETVKTVYTGGLRNRVSNARWQFISSLDDLEQQTSYAHSKNIEFNIALNASCIGQNTGDKQWWKEVTAYLKDLESAGVDGIIASHPFVMELVKEHTCMQLVVSTICDVRNGRTASHFEKLGADVLVTSMNINWNFKALKEIKRALKKTKLRLLVNEFCLSECSLRRFHHNHATHGGDNVDYFANCVRVLLSDPPQFLKNSAIRPEDLHLFEEITDDFKIVSRMTRPDYIIKMIEAYSSRSFKGNFMDLFGTEFSDKIHIDNSKLSELAAIKVKCDNNCYECDICPQMYNRIAGVS